MQQYQHRASARKYPISHDRLVYLGHLGFRRRLRWQKPFTVAVFKVVRTRLGAR